MCEKCWNADEITQESSFCPQTQEPYVITLQQLKEEVVKKWLETGNRNYRVNKSTVFNPPKESYAWEATKTTENGRPIEEALLSVHFIGS